MEALELVRDVAGLAERHALFLLLGVRGQVGRWGMGGGGGGGGLGEGLEGAALHHGGELQHDGGRIEEAVGALEGGRLDGEERLDGAEEGGQQVGEQGGGGGQVRGGGVVGEGVGDVVVQHLDGAAREGDVGCGARHGLEGRGEQGVTGWARLSQPW